MSKSWLSPSLLSAGLIAVLVGYTSSAPIVFEAARAAGASPAEVASWLWALGLGMGVTCIGLSLATRAPVLTAWSTPGAALLATSLHGVTMAQAVGAFVFAGAATTLVGFSGTFERLMRRVPSSLASAMLAGVLLQFGIDLFGLFDGHRALVGGMLVAFVLARRYVPRYAVPLTLVAGIALSAAAGQLHLGSVALRLALPLPTWPQWNAGAIVGIGVPLFLVTMASQNMPGLVVLRSNGYRVPASPLIGSTGLAWVLLAPFGGFAYNLAAITAAICMSPNAHPDAAQRWRASVWAGVFYLLTGVFGATMAALLAAFPAALIGAIAGLALLGTIASSLHGALAEPAERDAALITFLLTASGLSVLGLGSAFWGLLAGLAVSLLQHKDQPAK
ncbi:inner membrane protein YdcO [mine drainage metagenome]|uniref:Inner membrane protein YdcO n=1 Tax=mine drainage metagenome TaxID=410659 RepID=A0A1J5QMJ8_9ZZZZ